MISKVTVQNFKRFKSSTEFNIKPEGVTFLAGGNNSGKSTLLQALAVWEFARTVIEYTRSPQSLLSGWNGQGVGVSMAEFSPIALPNLKHLWTDLHIASNAGQYSLRIRCDWQTADTPPQAKFLECGLALENERLFFKPTASNLVAEDKIPRLAYLPPFAGIGSKEEWMLPAARKRWIGRGLAGAVLRNVLYDLWKENSRQLNAAKGPNGRIPAKARAQIRRDDGWEQLLESLAEVFKIGLTMNEFNQLYHDSIEVFSWDGKLVQKRFQKTGPIKDLMIEGSGFLQWLSVYALAVDKNLDVLLLDEPDAHLHPALQGYLIQKLRELARQNKKQVLLATHSTTILSETQLDRILRIEDRAYLNDENGRVKLFVGLGSMYAPRLDQLKRHKRLFLHDGPSDLEILKAWAQTLGTPWPDNLVCWKYTKNEEARRILFDELKDEIPGLKAISLQDRDDYPLAETKGDLTFGSLPLFKKDLGLRRWRRRNIENYLLHPAVIARVSGHPEQDILTFLQTQHGLAVTGNFTASDCPQTLANTDGKDILTKHANSITAQFGVTYLDIAKAMQAAEIPDDTKNLIQQIVDLCQP